MSLWLAQTATLLAQVAASGNPQDESGGGWLLLAGPAAGIAVYSMLFRYYRNTDKSHSFERETTIESQPVTGTDAKVEEVRGTQRSAIEGNNVSAYRQRVQRVR